MNIDKFKQAIERHWKFHAPSRTLQWKLKEAEDGWQIEVAPVFQEVVGGEQDGQILWSPFRYDLSGFMAERGVLVENILAASYCSQCSEPYLGVRGTYYARAFDLRIHLEPIPNSEPVEIIDTLKHQVRDIGEKEL